MARYLELKALHSQQFLSRAANANLKQTLKLGEPSLKAGRPARVLTEHTVAAWYHSSARREPEALAAKEAMHLARFLDVLYERPAVVKTIGVNSFTIEERLWNRASKR